MRVFVLAAMAVSCLFSVPGFGLAIEELAPPSFSAGGGKVVPVDFRLVELRLDFDVAGKSKGRAIVEFVSLEDGWPMFDLVPNITMARLNGVNISPSLIPVISTPDKATRVRVIKANVTKGLANVLELEFDIKYASVSNGRVRAGFFMSDLASGGREFWEQYGPANFEFDAFQMELSINVINGSTDHELFANGEIKETGHDSWKVVFPDYFTTSSFFVHLTEVGRFSVRTGTYNGIDAPIPLTVYAKSGTLAQSAYDKSMRVMKELEQTYGAFAHKKLVVYTTDNGGGMEHCGATMTSLWALGHELTHSWFARGVMPANGNAGWIDEAIASWRDDGYPRASGAPNRSPRNLGGFGNYRRHTTRDAYSYGADLISEFDFMFKNQQGGGQPGMRSVLNRMFEKFKRTLITVGMFKSFLESETGQGLDSVFDRYVLGKTFTQDFFNPLKPKNWHLPTIKRRGLHPRPFTPEERRALQ